MSTTRPTRARLRDAGRADATVRAAGTLPWRPAGADGRGLEVALVHRPRYDDWSWPKGKLDRGEEPVVAAVRETLEETGLLVRVGVPLPRADYLVRGQDKRVDYWAAQLVRDTRRGPQSKHEIDEVSWFDPATARGLLTYDRDAVQLDALVAAHERDALDTWPLVLIRHAHAVARGSWTRADPTRPLDALGRRRAASLVPLLDAYAPTRLLTSPSVRCRDTVLPWARHAALDPRERDGLSEEGYAASPAKAPRHLRRLLERGGPAALCSHGPLLPDLLDALGPHATDDDTGTGVRDELARLRSTNLDKGEALVLHVRGTGDAARVVALERHRPA